MIYAADFETTTDAKDCRVWAWAFCEVDNIDNFVYDKDIDSMMKYCASSKDNITLYFHNLKFDGEFILSWLFHNGYTHVTDRKKMKSKTFTTLITDRGVFFSLEICFLKTDKVNNTLKILDSLKLLPFPVDSDDKNAPSVAKAFNLPISKLKIDYREFREIGHELTKHEIAYIKNDVTIVAMALKELFAQGLSKMTTASNAMKSYKDIITKKKFDKWFPITEYDTEIRESYRGGFTYLNPNFKSVDVGEGIVLDVNSLYPSIMYYEKLPYGEGICFEGQYVPDKVYDLYVQMFSCHFELKKGRIPTVQLKNNLAFFNPIEYLTTSDNPEGKPITMCMTCVDFELFLEQYDVYDITFHSGWKFKSAVGLFKGYIDKWNGIKVQASIDNNMGLRTIAKLMLNAFYGKFALNPNTQSKYPYLGEDDIVHYRLGPKERRKPIYIPVGTFTTSYARRKTITSAQSVYERFIYADTDSLHLMGSVIPENLDISDTELGKWKVESHFERARFLRQKSYVEEINGKLKITCAGMPSSCYPHVTWDNFKIGKDFPGKLKINHTQGGIILLDAPHTLRE